MYSILLFLLVSHGTLGAGDYLQTGYHIPIGNYATLEACETERKLLEARLVAAPDAAASTGTRFEWAKSAPCVKMK